MRLNEDNFIEQYVELSIAQGEAYDKLNTDEWKEMRQITNRLAAKSARYEDFLAKRPEFARKTLDTLISCENIYVMKNVAFLLWDFDYRMDDCCRLFEQIIANTEDKYALTTFAAKYAYLAIKEERLKRRKQFPKLD